LQDVAVLMEEMGLTAADIASRLHAARIERDDIERLKSIGQLISNYAEAATEEFISYLRDSPETAALLHDETVERIRRLKRLHIQEMGHGDYGQYYVAQRLELASLYSRIGLPLRWFLGAFHHLTRSIGQHILEDGKKHADRALAAYQSFNKLSIYDASLMGDTLVFQREQTIRRQEEAIRELSTPVLRIRDRLLILPVIGTVDPPRARLLTNGLLAAIRDNRAKVVIMDVTGVPALDSNAANHLVEAVEAGRLMGATVILTGVAAENAHTLVKLGIDLATIPTIGDLQAGLEEGERLLGYVVRKRKKSDAAKQREGRPAKPQGDTVHAEDWQR
jgi:rsbT co-antagonist protein RsbR